ncbi:methionine--tRNA ligase [Candidatus Saccharibacteria bacterium]|nr:methionine--tRNA ligase [Candidatus Saccharibacteria bacterium]
MSKNVYLTTAIPYVNGAPHIGHAMDYLLADTYARYQKSLGNNVRFQAGTDEHGNKIFKKAKELNVPVQEYVDTNARKFQDFIKKLGVENTDFIRTSDKEHARRCQEIWRRLSDHIYKNSYEGWYCEGCERFITEKEVEENGGICPDHQKPYEKLEEENYYLRISDFKAEIAQKIESGEMLVLPDFRKNEVLKLLEDTPDVSISRPTEHLSWGVPVPDDPSQVMYVWVDALANYITVLGYPEQDISDFWPAEVQFVGKDILRFHAIIWPAILLGLGLPLPKVLHSHGHILANGAKMSKSIGNVVDPLEVVERHGLAAFRYYFLRHCDTFLDSDFTWDDFERAYAGELANDLGNLVQRLATLCKKADLSGIKFETPKLDAEYKKLMDEFYFSRAFDVAWGEVQDVNKAIDETKPWMIAKEGNTEKLEEVLNELTEQLLTANNLIAPFLPDTSAKILSIFTAEKILPPEVPLFPKD